jgi:8-oxo-dGTP diphosphatase
MSGHVQCPACGGQVPVYRNPLPTVDVVISFPDQGVVLIKRRNPPYGWALPGGFVDYGESVEQAAVREAKEETGLDVRLHGLLGVYSSPDRDPRQHTMSVVFMGTAKKESRLQAGDDAGQTRVAPLDDLPELAFDHARILADFQQALEQGRSRSTVRFGRSLGF